MQDDYTYKDYVKADLENATHTQQRGQMYFLALGFTILAVAIHTATFHGTILPDAIELLAWWVLLIGGIIGLWGQR